MIPVEGLWTRVQVHSKGSIPRGKAPRAQPRTRLFAELAGRRRPSTPGAPERVRTRAAAPIVPGLFIPEARPCLRPPRLARAGSKAARASAPTRGEPEALCPRASGGTVVGGEGAASAGCPRSAHAGFRPRARRRCDTRCPREPSLGKSSWNRVPTSMGARSADSAFTLSAARSTRSPRTQSARPGLESMRRKTSGATSTGPSVRARAHAPGPRPVTPLALPPDNAVGVVDGAPTPSEAPFQPCASRARRPVPRRRRSDRCAVVLASCSWLQKSTVHAGSPACPSRHALRGPSHAGSPRWRTRRSRPTGEGNVTWMRRAPRAPPSWRTRRWPSMEGAPVRSTPPAFDEATAGPALATANVAQPGFRLAPDAAVATGSARGRATPSGPRSKTPAPDRKTQWSRRSRLLQDCACALLLRTLARAQARTGDGGGSGRPPRRSWSTAVKPRSTRRTARARIERREP